MAWNVLIKKLYNFQIDLHILNNIILRSKLLFVVVSHIIGFESVVFCVTE